MGNEISSFIKYLQHTNKYSESKAHAISVNVTYKDELQKFTLLWSTRKPKIQNKKKVVQINEQVWSINIISRNYLLISWLVDHWCPSTGVGSHFVGVEFLIFCHHFLFPQRVLTQNLLVVLS